MVGKSNGRIDDEQCTWRYCGAESSLALTTWSPPFRKKMQEDSVLFVRDIFFTLSTPLIPLLVSRTCMISNQFPRARAGIVDSFEDLARVREKNM